MSQSKFKTFFIGTSAFAILASLGSFVHKHYWQPKRTSLWTTRETNNLPRRQPAQFKASELPILEDFFDYNSFHHYISYKINLEFLADAKNKDKERAKLALDQTLKDLFEKNSKKAVLKAFSSPSLSNDFLSQYLKRLDDKNVDNGEYQIDFEFTPQNHPSLHFNKETQIVGLWNLNHVGSLKALKGDSGYNAHIPESSEYDLIRKIVSTDYPNESQYFQYQGGTISLKIALDDMSWDSEDARSTKPEAVDGDILYRRYFKVVHEDEFAFSLDHPDLTISSSAMIRKHEDNSIFFTVDISKDFNGHTLYAPKERLAVHFGEMLPTQKRKRGFLQRVFGQDREKTYNTGEFKIFGRLGRGERGLEYEATIHTLVFDLSTMRLNLEDSRVSVTIKNDTLSNFDKAAATNEVKGILFGPLAGRLIGALALERFHPSLAQPAGGR